MTFALILLIVAAAAGYLWMKERARSAAVRRLERLTSEPDDDSRPDIARDTPPGTYPPRHRLAPAVVGITIGVVLLVVFRFPTVISLAIVSLATVLCYLLESTVAEQRKLRLEMQLVDAIDMLIGSLRAGSSLIAGFDTAVAELRTPLRPFLEEVAGRIRLGDDPKTALAGLPQRVPLETVRLFASALIVHWEVGGSLATTLATVGRTIRDRIELSRRVRAQGVESHVSVAVVMIITYVLGYLMFRTNPDRLLAFLRTEIGAYLVAAAIILQAVGLVWMAQMSRSNF